MSQNFFHGRLYLIGARSSGKSTVGGMLAAQLGWTFAETDAMAEEIMGQSISQAVEKLGWDAFRDAESQALTQAAALEPAIVSTGGGIVVRPQNRELMSKTGLIAYLCAGGDELARRLSVNLGGRPSLTGEHPAREIIRVLQERDPLYRELAHFIIDAERPVQLVCEDLLKICRDRAVHDA
ncbi:MAG: shikimate kinase AroL [Desulfovibrionaceae bacterium]|nr:shikimate kinase AroL [Desulfovibrionaceae bacterium]